MIERGVCSISISIPITFHIVFINTDIYGGIGLVALKKVVVPKRESTSNPSPSPSELCS